MAVKLLTPNVNLRIRNLLNSDAAQKCTNSAIYTISSITAHTHTRIHRKKRINNHKLQELRAKKKFQSRYFRLWITRFIFAYCGRGREKKNPFANDNRVARSHTIWNKRGKKQRFGVRKMRECTCELKDFFHSLWSEKKIRVCKSCFSILDVFFAPFFSPMKLTFSIDHNQVWQEIQCAFGIGKCVSLFQYALKLTTWNWNKSVWQRKKENGNNKLISVSIKMCAQHQFRCWCFNMFFFLTSLVVLLLTKLESNNIEHCESDFLFYFSRVKWTR